MSVNPDLNRNITGVILVKGGQVRFRVICINITMVLLNGVFFSLQVLNKDNEFDSIYDDKHSAISTNGFTTPPQFTNLMNILSTPFVSMDRLVACMNECRVVSKDGRCFYCMLQFVYGFFCLSYSTDKFNIHSLVTCL